MQIFRLVDPGRVDRCIGFDELPNRLLTGIRRGPIEGFPRHWKDFFGITRDAKDPRPFYLLEYTMLNADKERWQQITSYVRSATDKKVRLLDKIEDMAMIMAPDSHHELTLEPEDITIIPIAKEEEEVLEVKKPEVKKVEAKVEEKKDAPLIKRRGRPKRETVAA